MRLRRRYMRYVRPWPSGLVALKALSGAALKALLQLKLPYARAWKSRRMFGPVERRIGGMTDQL